MSHHSDLLQQAFQLAHHEPKRPKQASLRRAVSSGYYSLFHFLIDQSVRRVVGHAHAREEVRHAFGRCFEHSEMKEICQAFAKNQAKALPNPLQPLFPPPPGIPLEVIDIAETFIEAQAKRHEADYNLAATFVRADVLRLLAHIQTACSNWHAVRNDPIAHTFLIALTAGKKLKGR